MSGLRDDQDYELGTLNNPSLVDEVHPITAKTLSQFSNVEMVQTNR